MLPLFTLVLAGLSTPCCGHGRHVERLRETGLDAQIRERLREQLRRREISDPAR